MTFLKLKNLKNTISDMKSVLIASSGGVDSSFLLLIAKEVLPDNTVAATATGPIFPSYEIKDARKIANFLDVKQKFFDVHQLENPNFVNNPKNRCYICKKMMFSSLLEIASQNDLNYILDGSNYSDADAYRPGRKAAIEFGIKSPLEEVGLTKLEIRNFSKKFGLKNWDKFPNTCLATRIPYNEKLTIDKLERIDKAESFLRKLGIKGARVREHNNIARIETIKEDIIKFTQPKLIQQITESFKELGYKHITLDLEGYRRSGK
ncbi:ATP-dependent sacrificial sulfur transferase LarE [candidate division WOR-3 bacterium]|nr:ATP-dependent sacrificial sulfur transferase LarE [candidate division WOR-3 bacterium]